MSGDERERVRRSLEANTWRVESGCLIWLGRANRRQGLLPYGKMNAVIGGRKRTLAAHRAAYMVERDIPAGMDIDHLCRTPSCVETDHLEAVTQIENLRRRPRSGRFRLAVKGDICGKHGVEVEPYGAYKGSEYYRCAECRREYQREYRRSRKAA